MDATPTAAKAAAKVAVVIVNFRTPGMTADCVRSLAAAHPGQLRFYVVENASADGSWESLASLRDEATLILAAENGGYTAGNNLGIAAALADGAERVLIVNPDTVAAGPFVGQLAAHLDAHPAVGAVGPRVFLRRPGNVQNTVLRFPWVGRRVADWFRSRLGGIKARSGSACRPAEALNGVCVLFRAECLRQVGAFDPLVFAYIEDIDWAYRARRAGWRCNYLPVDGVLHLQKEEGYRRGGTVDFLLKRNTLYFLLKTGHYVQALAYTAATLTLAACQTSWKHAGRLAASYAGLWSFRWHATMGKPSLPGGAA